MAFTLSGDDACQITPPSPIPNPYWVAFSSSAAKLIGLEIGSNELPADATWLEVCAGNALSSTSHQFTQPLSTVYSGHQFGVWAGQLGDGRAILLGEIQGQELQLKGAGKTRYSRMGDGRAVLRSSIREFLCSEAMYSLGIPTTRALSVVGSEMPVRREIMETAAVCTRLAPSFLRIGHFEHFASLQNTSRLAELANLLIQDHYSECQNASNPYLELFKQICQRNAKLVAQWQAVGFCHGVLNSDNISAIGLTMDYGPFGFMDQFQIDHICNHSDQGGRYAYHRQPQIMHWNMACLASAFLPLLELSNDASEAQSLLREALEEFPVAYASAWQSLFRQKIGLMTEDDGDIRLIERLLQAMHDSKVDFTYFFRQLSQTRQNQDIQTICLRDHFIDRSSIDQWFSDYINRLKSENSDDGERRKLMNAANPKYILRNHLAQAAIDKAKQHDFSEVKRLLEILSRPYDEQPEYETYAMPPPPDLEKVEVSCSS
ncbi:YdiU family protein [Polynucleobacter sp. MWH-UH2A]|uniref:protein adenylyltransferase SelO n=1 Tax=Polynucleobacter sp. MWH-UH2A TaxID=1855617 RepID=UPI001BFE6E11|nr:YdiU family protein [Polynucleobacter sp. MWH-UH2A]QWD65013.1 YdiU family protein [Polynucleobacter sp. MWH-UH2A]